MNIRAKIELIYDFLQSQKWLKEINNFSLFFDEPRFFGFGARLSLSQIQKKRLYILAMGGSLVSSEIALLKCLAECLERINLYLISKKNIVFTSPEKLKEKLYHFPFLKSSSITQKIGFLKTKSLTDNDSRYVPAQFVYLNFPNIYKEPILGPIISTGAVGGFSHEETLLSGIYEIVERDAFMTAYLNKISVPKIALESFRDPIIQSIINRCLRYRLELNVFETTNDLGIPSFMVVIIDKTGVGPAVNVGLKSGFDPVEAVIGSITEALQIRISIRNNLLKDVEKENKKNIESINDRAHFWSKKEMIPKLNFLLAVQSKRIALRKKTKVSKKKELEIILQIFKEKKISASYIDMTMPLYRRLSFRVYKVFIPDLHPLYLNEKYKIIDVKRLQTAASFFGKKRYTINPVPHPFL